MYNNSISYLSDNTEFYQLLTYKGDRKLDKQLAEWEKFYNFYRPHGGLRGKTPYEMLKKKLTSWYILTVSASSSYHN